MRSSDNSVDIPAEEIVDDMLMRDDMEQSSTLSVSETGEGVSVSGNSSSGASSDPTYTMAEVVLHNTASDCWMVVDGNVYDATAYASVHPAGAASIIRSCGQDVTSEYDRVRAHDSSRADTDLAGLFIGYLE